MGLKPLTKGSRASVTLDHWCTPHAVIEVVREFARGPVALDPCTNPMSIVGADVEYHGPDALSPAHRINGLVVPWRPEACEPRRRVVWVNPPYSAKHIWMQKCRDESARDPHMHILALVPNDSDTGWYQDIAVPSSSAVCFWKGRLVFRGDRDFPARFPSVLFYWGRASGSFRRLFKRYGWCPT